VPSGHGAAGVGGDPHGLREGIHLRGSGTVRRLGPAGGGHKECKDQGLVVQVGKEYMMQDRDVCNWKLKSRGGG
jgi:hypothetical protein